jgi:hypothetical protein
MTEFLPQNNSTDCHPWWVPMLKSPDKTPSDRSKQRVTKYGVMPKCLFYQEQEGSSVLENIWVQSIKCILLSRNVTRSFQKRKAFCVIKQTRENTQRKAAMDAWRSQRRSLKPRGETKGQVRGTGTCPGSGTAAACPQRLARVWGAWSSVWHSWVVWDL